MSDGPKDIDELLAIPELAAIAPGLRRQISPALRMRHAPGLPPPVDDTPPGADKPTSRARSPTRSTAAAASCCSSTSRGPTPSCRG